MICRVCGAECGAAIYRSDAPAISSLSTRLNVETAAYLCRTCGHAQSPDMDDLQTFYDTEYKISLASDGHDQLYEFRSGKPVYRTEHQASLVLNYAAPPEGARALDYGAAKAATLRSVLDARPDIRPAVFDVSEDYRRHWDAWIPAEDQATYRCPDAWNGRFDLVTAHFVLEHVGTPVEVFADIRRLLAPGGVAFVTVPDVLSNSGDLLVVDHVNHFTPPSIRAALSRADLRVRNILPDAFRGAFVIVAEAVGETETEGSEDLAETIDALEDTGRFWSAARERLLGAASQHGARPAAIYGAGFYGVFIASVLEGRQSLAGHLDRNPHVRAAAPVRPVFDPKDVPAEVEVIYAGLNPAIARTVLNEWQCETGRSYTCIYLDGDA